MKIKRQSIQEARESLVREVTIKCCIYDMLLVLNGLEGYGRTRLNRVFKEFKQTFMGLSGALRRGYDGRAGA